ncbi:MAG: hypothetical protein HOD43_13830 [Candidatus Marinimicrobia bacterium]|jgi:hypothetical protein|nr:hypothetical protein [Candidatus Neomarinimicrobiota bacterium]MBT3631154.1 hypothetical protein [Candidatus Neomarinimicrobiota bacterium]MBT3825052.1 hypothetical protein [Candidatus Neomarinimicrobiota bacterium]MBT4131395.1 hypothetical protein [Candidatus Neomarinimicrobiota bacterium]MBT4296874.1 hypothetical protein [Candidatus Neomarinimicrobiota bacterium]
MSIARIIISIVLIVSTASAKSANLDYIDDDNTEDMSINFVEFNQESIEGRLIFSDEAYYYFQSNGDASMQLILRSNVQYLETNMDINLHSILKGRDPNDLVDVIELNDGTRIPSIILDVGADSIQYFTGKTLKRETISASSIYMLYLDDATISIPFPIAAPDFAVL